MNPKRLRLLRQFKDLYRVEAGMLVTHVEFLRLYEERFGEDEWAKRLQGLIREEMGHLKICVRLLEIAIS